MNRLTSISFGNRSPYNMLSSKVPTLVHLRVISFFCYALVLLKGDKFFERAKPAMLMGYSTSQKGYLLMDLNTNKFFINRDIFFISMYSHFPTIQMRVKYQIS